MEERRTGRQNPTTSVILPYRDTKGQEAVDLYNSTGRTMYPWQTQLAYDIMAVNGDGLWTHSKFGYAVPRRNGKSEDVLARVMWGYTHGERILYTAHKTTTSSSISARFVEMLELSGYLEVIRIKQGESYDEMCFKVTKQLGLESVQHVDGSRGMVNFRTRTTTSGLGEGYDLLVIDEAQEYTDSQNTALKYVITDSDNPQMIMLGTPPTAVSAGTVFMDYRKACLHGDNPDSGWAEWSVEKQSDVRDRDLWYRCNPSLGYKLTERNIAAEIGSDDLDFNIQRLGLWLRYNQKSAISHEEWAQIEVKELPKLTGDMCVGIRYGHDNTNVALSIAVKTTDERIFIECVDCRSVREGNDWILSFLKSSKCKHVAGDGAAMQILANEMKTERMKKPMIITSKELIQACNLWEQAILQKTVCHMSQPSLEKSVTNCDHRAIGSNGGFGYCSIRDDTDIALMDSAILAYWACLNMKDKKAPRVSY